MRKVPLCTLCGEDVDSVTKCIICGAKFCSDCGEHDEKTCVYCYEEDEEWDSEWDDEDEWDE